MSRNPPPIIRKNIKAAIAGILAVIFATINLFFISPRVSLGGSGVVKDIIALLNLLLFAVLRVSLQVTF